MAGQYDYVFKVWWNSIFGYAFLCYKKTSVYNLNNYEDRKKFVNKSVEILNRFKLDKLDINFYVGLICNYSGFSKDLILSYLKQDNSIVKST